MGILSLFYSDPSAASPKMRDQEAEDGQPPEQDGQTAMCPVFPGGQGGNQGLQSVVEGEGTRSVGDDGKNIGTPGEDQSDDAQQRIGVPGG